MVSPVLLHGSSLLSGKHSGLLTERARVLMLADLALLPFLVWL